MSVTLARIVAKIGESVKRHKSTLYTGACLALVGWSTYNLGLISAHIGVAPLQEAALFRVRSTAVSSSAPASKTMVSSAPRVDHTDLRVAVSKSSTSKKYHYSWCSGAKRISAANKVWYDTAAAAQAAGYTLASNCKP